MIERSAKPGILISQADTTEELEPEFDEWYDTEHIPIRLALPGFDMAERYHSLDETSQKHLVLYHLGDLSVLESPAYADVKSGSGNTPLTQRMLGSVENFTRYIGEQVADSHPAAGARRASDFVLLLLGAVSTDSWPEVTQAHEQDYLPRLAEIAGWERGRRYRIFDGAPAGIDLAVLHEFGTLDALEAARLVLSDSAAWQERQVAAYRRRSDRANALPS